MLLSQESSSGPESGSDNFDTARNTGDSNSSATDSDSDGYVTPEHAKHNRHRRTGNGLKIRKRQPRLTVPPRAKFPSPDRCFTFAGGYQCPSLDHRDGSFCQVLQLLDLVFFSELHAVASTTLLGGSLIPASLIHSFIRTHSASAFQFGRRLLLDDEWGQIANHIIVAHDLDRNQTSGALRSLLPSNLASPLPVEGMCENASCVAKFFKCPAPGCPDWCISSPSVDKYNIRHHYRRHDPLGAATMVYESRMVQRIAIYGAGSNNQRVFHHFLLPIDFNTHQRPTQLPPSLTFGQSERSPVNERIQEGLWLAKLGWTQYLESLGPLTSLRALRALVEPPSSVLVNNARLSCEVKYIEMGLIELQREVTLYLLNAHDYLESRHPNVRKKVTQT